MSHTNHKAVCITSMDLEAVAKLRHEIKRNTTCMLSLTYQSSVNGYKTFFVVPCGSKAGWDEDVEHLQNIEKIKDLISEFQDEDGSNCIKYAICSYGETQG